MEYHTDTNDNFTRLADYPAIAAEKITLALERISIVHSRFLDELKTMDEEFHKQYGHADIASSCCKNTGPYFDTIGKNLNSISNVIGDAENLVRSGSLSLSQAVDNIKSIVTEIQDRTERMRDIEKSGEAISQNVAMVAETAVENKLIAINAAVTASKASDRVKGFKVIASEISDLSAFMSEKVQAIVEQSSMVGQRMQTIVQNMNDSIQSTEKTVGNIDEALKLLDSIAEAILEARNMNRKMLESYTELVSENTSIGKSMHAIEGAINNTKEKTGSIHKEMNEQARFIDELARLVPDLQSLTKKMAATADRTQSEAPKRFIMAELPVFDYDPAHARYIRETQLASFTFLRLLRYSSDKKIVPYFADTWVLLPDNRTWEFTLNKTAVFFDGSPISSRDIKFSLERLMNPAFASPYANLFSVIEGADEHIAGTARGISGIIVKDPHTIQIRLKSAFNYFLSLMTLAFSAIIKENQALYSRKSERGESQSAGPFSFAPKENEETDSLKSFPEFINGKPFLDGLDIKRNIEDTATALLNGEINAAYNVSAALGEELKQKGFKGKIKPYTSRYCFGLTINYKRPSWIARHKELYHALSMAFDKEGLIDYALNGNADRADMVLQHSIAGTDGKAVIPYNLEKAKAIFEEWRPKGVLDTPLKIAIRDIPAFPDTKLIVRFIERLFSDLKLPVEVEIIDIKLSLKMAEDKYDLVLLGFIGEIDFYTALEPFINPNGGDNWLGYNNPAMMERLESSIQIKDTNERQEFFREILHDFTLDGFIIPLFFQKMLLITTEDVNSVFMGPEETFYTDNIYLWPPGAKSGIAGVHLDEYERAVSRIEEEAGRIVKKSSLLVSIGMETGKSLRAQQHDIEAASSNFNSFLKKAGETDETRTELARIIHTTAREASRSEEVSQIIKTGLLELAATIDATRKALGQVIEDIDIMLEISTNISSSNEFISSIAVNAAIIAAKSETGTGDLRKVSESIAEQASRNTDYSSRILESLAAMARSTREHEQALDTISLNMNAIIRQISEIGAVLDKAGPCLEEAENLSIETNRNSDLLSKAIEEAGQTVKLIHEEASQLAVQTDTLKFGLDLEQGVVDILRDVVSINVEICHRVRNN